MAGMSGTIPKLFENVFQKFNLSKLYMSRSTFADDMDVEKET